MLNLNGFGNTAQWGQHWPPTTWTTLSLSLPDKRGKPTCPLAPIISPDNQNKIGAFHFKPYCGYLASEQHCIKKVTEIEHIFKYSIQNQVSPQDCLFTQQAQGWHENWFIKHYDFEESSLKYYLVNS